MPIILGIQVDNINQQKALKKIEGFLRDGKQHYIVTPNPEIVLFASKEENSEYRRSALNQADLKIPDGVGLIAASWILGVPLHHRVTGTDLMIEICGLAAKEGRTVFLFGGEEGVARECQKVLEERYKGLRVVGVSDGKITKSEIRFPSPKANNPKFETNSKSQISNNYQLPNIINQTEPDILFVALGAPKQEEWIAENLKSLPTVKLAMGVGGAFDFISGRVKRAPLLWRQIGLEWLWRLLKQPWRVKRIYDATLKFMFVVLKWRWRMCFVYRRNVVGCIVRGGSSVVECLLPKQKIAGSTPVHRSIEILLVERQDEPGHWQLPQGGTNQGETTERAVLREMKEELGTDKFKIVKTIPCFYQYKWPKINQLCHGYRGQKQDLFILEFIGKDEDIELDHKEHIDFKWVAVDEVVSAVHQIRKEQAEKAIEKLRLKIRIEE